jgi:hypothetical protein
LWTHRFGHAGLFASRYSRQANRRPLSNVV